MAAPPCRCTRRIPATETGWKEQTLSKPPADVRRVAVYPGAFDPVHLGHVDVARRAAAIFDHLIVAVFDRPNKRLTFSGEERVDLFRQALLDVPNTSVLCYAGLTIDFALEQRAGVLVRGLRSTADYDYESQMVLMNRHLAPALDTVFLVTAQEHAHLSSSLVKEVAAQGARLDGLVPKHVARALRQLYGQDP